MLSPRARWPRSTSAAIADSVFGDRPASWSATARSMSPPMVSGRSAGVPSQTNGRVCPPATTAPEPSRSTNWKSAHRV